MQRFVPAPVLHRPEQNWFVALLSRFEVQATLSIIFILLAIHYRDRQNSPIFAFLGGMGASYIARHWLIH